MNKAVILMSGGLDSTTVAAIAKDLGYELYCISFDYGQRHRIELACAKKNARFFNARRHLIYRLDLRCFGGSALTSKIKVPEDRLLSPLSGQEIPVTYVPARNTVFLSIALSWAETIKAQDIFIGVNSLDYSGYPDCRPAFIKAFEKLANLGTREGVKGKKFRIHTPLLHLKKSQIIKKGLSLGVDYALTSSCYQPSPQSIACGHCDSCLLRLKGFQEAGFTDPIKYR
ncbi:MAG: 7-cyano-7-deazaguanine synthase QueC [Candidatus Aureabacteria bacterium]|nr:7-cyano-7-deazaguanine synthase QueC [Candidatus Auribacterota bacterium]